LWLRRPAEILRWFGGPGRLSAPDPGLHLRRRVPDRPRCRVGTV